MPPELLTMQEDFAAAISGQAAGALSVYRNTVIQGAVEALRGNYPVVEEIVGTEMFEAVAADFVSTCPPQSPILALYGGEFADWLGHQEWVCDLPYLPDVARVERLRVESLCAADAEPILELPGLVDLDVFYPKLHPATRFAWLSTPGMSIWLAHQRPIGVAIEPEWNAEGVLFARPTPFTFHAPRIGRAGNRMLCGVRIGESLGAALAAATRLYPEENPGALLASLMTLGVFVAPEPERT